ncbi:MAG: nucleotidyltransferase domain-containing protein [Verrucomicrobiae bacterium]|nr:nucleotidyltransferase domain-containing protein [Verrucomicrobiae bacterium]
MQNQTFEVRPKRKIADIDGIHLPDSIEAQMNPGLTLTREIEEACKAFKVSRLHVFGSANLGDISHVHDIDLIVEFERDGYSGAFEQFMGFKEAMESILGRPVDLLSAKRFRNQIFQAEVEKTKRLVYAA